MEFSCLRYEKTLSPGKDNSIYNITSEYTLYYKVHVPGQEICVVQRRQGKITADITAQLFVVGVKEVDYHWYG